MLTTLDQCCKFVSDWFGTNPSFPGTQPVSADLPAPIQALHQRFGLIWKSDAHPLPAPNDGHGRRLSLFNVQDRIIDPTEYRPDDTGTIALPCTVPLWNHPAWDFAGFWTNPDRTKLQYAEAFLTVTPPN